MYVCMYVCIREKELVNKVACESYNINVLIYCFFLDNKPMAGEK